MWILHSFSSCAASSASVSSDLKALYKSVIIIVIIIITFVAFTDILSNRRGSWLPLRWFAVDRTRWNLYPHKKYDMKCFGACVQIFLPMFRSGFRQIAQGLLTDTYLEAHVCCSFLNFIY